MISYVYDFLRNFEEQHPIYDVAVAQSFLLTITHDRSWLALEERDGADSLVKLAKMAMRRISRKTKSNVTWVWSGGKQKNGFQRQHLHLFARFERHLEVKRVQNEFRDSIKAIRSHKRYAFRLNDPLAVLGCPTQADADEALGYVIYSDRNPVISNEWIETFSSSGEFRRAKRTEQTRDT